MPTLVKKLFFKGWVRGRKIPESFGVPHRSPTLLSRRIERTINQFSKKFPFPLSIWSFSRNVSTCHLYCILCIRKFPFEIVEWKTLMGGLKGDGVSEFEFSDNFRCVCGGGGVASSLAYLL